MSENYLKTNESDFYAEVLKDYGKPKEELEEYVDILREWAVGQPHFPEKPPRSILKSLILYNKFSVEKAKQKLDMFYTIRGLMPELYHKHPLSPEMIEQSKITFIVPLPKLTSNFERIIYMKFNPDYSADDFIHERWAAHFINVVELLLEADDCFKFQLIFDTSNFQFKHLTKFNFMILKKASSATEEVYSTRMTSIYWVNFSSFLENLMNSMKLVLTKKMNERLQIHSSGDVLLEKFGKEYLPRDAGGDLPSLTELNEQLIKEFEHHKDRFDHLQTLQVNESLRPVKLKNDEVLGYYGNFKKINID